MRRPEIREGTIDSKANMAQQMLPHKPSLIVTNPPYGNRTGEEVKDIQGLYKSLGTRLSLFKTLSPSPLSPDTSPLSMLIVL